MTAAERMRRLRERRRAAGLKAVVAWVPTESGTQPTYSSHRFEARSLAMHAVITRKIERDPALLAMFASWHDFHEGARKALVGSVRLIDHCALETYSVLTRLPPPERCTGTPVRDFLRSRFDEPYLRLETRAYKESVLELPDHAMTGGAAYDALVAVTAVGHSAKLITCDRRAASTYESYGVRVIFLV